MGLLDHMGWMAPWPKLLLEVGSSMGLDKVVEGFIFHLLIHSSFIFNCLPLFLILFHPSLVHHPSATAFNVQNASLLLTQESA